MSDTSNKSPISAILLAAGESRRMGKINKLQLELGSVSLLQRIVQTLLLSPLQEIVVVLGHQADQTALLVKELPVTVVVNEDYQQGQMTSVQAGLKALTQLCDGVMICLSDQPLLTRKDINIIIDAFNKQTHGSILVPTFEGKRGNPIILDYQHRDTILAGDRSFGCKRLIERHPELVTTIAMSTNHVIIDIDNQEDYASIQQLFDKTHYPLYRNKQ